MTEAGDKIAAANASHRASVEASRASAVALAEKRDNELLAASETRGLPSLPLAASGESVRR